MLNAVAPFFLTAEIRPSHLRFQNCLYVFNEIQFDHQGDEDMPTDVTDTLAAASFWYAATVAKTMNAF